MVQHGKRRPREPHPPPSSSSTPSVIVESPQDSHQSQSLDPSDVSEASSAYRPPIFFPYFGY